MFNEVFRSQISRRRLLAMMVHGAIGMAFARPVLATRQSPVVVLTAYPDEVIGHFEAAFERAWPQYRLHMLWRMPRDAADYLLQPGSGEVDVYWSASPRTFERLKAGGVLRPFSVDRQALPAQLGGSPLSDPGSFYHASEVAGYGFVVNVSELQRRRVAIPADWGDLADPRLAGAIVLPQPGRVGFASVMADIVLQSLGWEAGWALWSEIGGLARLIERGGGAVAEDVADGAAVGLSIDFFVRSAIARGAPVQFVYPRQGGVNPAHVAILREAPNPEGAAAFVDFILSPEGQRILAHADIHKLPVRPDVYAGLPADYHNPFRQAEAGGYAYDNAAGRERLALVDGLFQSVIAHEHARLVSIWARIHAAEQAGIETALVREALCTMPVGSGEVSGVQALLAQRLEGEQTLPEALSERWGAQVRAARTRAEDMLKDLGA